MSPANSIRPHCTFNKARSVPSERDWREIPPHASQSVHAQCAHAHAYPK